MILYTFLGLYFEIELLLPLPLHTQKIKAYSSQVLSSPSLLLNTFLLPPNSSILLRLPTHPHHYSSLPLLLLTQTLSHPYYYPPYSTIHFNELKLFLNKFKEHKLYLLFCHKKFKIHVISYLFRVLSN